MNSYNLIDEPWIRVGYEDSSIESVGLRKLFESLKNIKSLETQVFHSTKAYLYDPAITHFLSVIVLAANYKQGSDSAMTMNEKFAKKQLKTGIDTDVVLNYPETFRDRFDLFSEKRPFLQNPALKDDPGNEPIEHYERTFNPIMYRAKCTGNRFYAYSAGGRQAGILHDERNKRRRPC